MTSILLGILGLAGWAYLIHDSITEPERNKKRWAEEAAKKNREECEKFNRENEHVNFLYPKG